MVEVLRSSRLPSGRHDRARHQRAALVSSAPQMEISADRAARRVRLMPNIHQLRTNAEPPGKTPRAAPARCQPRAERGRLVRGGLTNRHQNNEFRFVNINKQVTPSARDDRLDGVARIEVTRTDRASRAAPSHTGTDTPARTRRRKTECLRGENTCSLGNMAHGCSTHAFISLWQD